MVRPCLGALTAAALLLMVSSARAQTVTPSPERLTTPGTLRAAVTTSVWFGAKDGGQGPRLTRSMVVPDSVARPRQQREPQKRSWIGRHPVLFGTMVGFGAGFLIGYLPGDDGVFDDFTAEFNGLVLGGAGAAVGAGIGAIAGAATK